MLGAFLDLHTKATWVFLILALKSGFKRHVSNFSFISSFALPCMILFTGMLKDVFEAVMM